MLAVQFLQIKITAVTVSWMPACMLMPFQAAYVSEPPVLDETIMRPSFVFCLDNFRSVK